MPQQGEKISHCHVQIRKTAIGLAEQNYDELMSSDWIYKEWKRQHPGMPARALRKLFVDKNWGRYVPAARAMLAALLRNPIDPALGEEIMEVLMLDSTLIRGRLNPATVAGTLASPK